MNKQVTTPKECLHAAHYTFIKCVETVLYKSAKPIKQLWLLMMLTAYPR